MTRCEKGPEATPAPPEARPFSVRFLLSSPLTSTLPPSHDTPPPLLLLSKCGTTAAPMSAPQVLRLPGPAPERSGRKGWSGGGSGEESGWSGVGVGVK